MSKTVLSRMKIRSLLLVVIGVILPVIYITSLLVYNYQDNIALQDSAIKRYKLDVEKQSETLGYYFLERKYDIRAIADSVEVFTYFTNRSLGMSEQYGLKVSLFSISQMLNKTVVNKTINDRSIYEKFVFVGTDKRIIAGSKIASLPGDDCWLDELDNILKEPKFILHATDNSTEILVASPCFFKKKLSGWVITWLQVETLYANFIKRSSQVSSKTFGLTLKSGAVIHPAYDDEFSTAIPLDLQNVNLINDLELVSIEHNTNGNKQQLLFTHINIHATPLYLAACVDKNEIYGSARPWQLLIAAGGIILLSLVGMFVFISNNTRQLILKTRVDEINKQQNHLKEKNSLLKSEIEKRKQAEVFIKEKEERYRNLFESSGDAIFIVQDSVIIDCNHSSVQLLGVTYNDIIGRKIFDFAPPVQSDGSNSRSTFESREKQSAVSPQHFEWLLMNKEQRPLLVDIDITILSAENHIINQVIVRDITERKRTQELLVQTEKMMAVGGLAAGMAHEINNPLGVILQANQNLERRLGTKLKKNQMTADEIGLDFEKLQQYLDEKSIPTYLQSIRSAGERAAKIVKSMLEFSRSSKISNKQLSDITELIDSAVEMARKDYDLKQQFDFKNIVIERKYSPVDQALCERTEIGQVFLNIIKNAAQAMHTSSTNNPKLLLTVDQTMSDIIITIEDNGPGMNDEIQSQIFEPFFTTKVVGEGTGLGLSVSYFIVTSHHGGKISVVSKLEHGAKFVISLPRQEHTGEIDGAKNTVN